MQRDGNAIISMETVHIEDVLKRIPRIEELQAARNQAQVPAWLVGGTPRDLLLNRVPVDVDIATQHPEPLARRFAALTGGRLVPMDVERGIWRVALPDGLYFDFCRFRDHDIVGDLRGRDFTINAIALRLPERTHAGGLLDPFHGVDDLNAGILRMVGPRAFRDDPARILRAFRFLAELRLDITDDTLAALRAESGHTAAPAPERLLAEWWKLCAGPFAARAIGQMDESDALGVLFPELRATKGVTQNAFHHLDVWEHLLLATTYMVRFLRDPEDVFQDLRPEFAPILDDPHLRARMVFLALIHDVGKPPTRSVKQGRVHFYGHETAGERMAEQLCLRLRMSREDTRAITTIIRHHLRPLFMMHAMKDGSLSRKVMGKFFDDTGPYAPQVMALALADKSAGQGPAAEPDVQERLRELYRELFTFYHEHYAPAHQQPFLTGEDLTAGLHLAPGPEVGRLLSRARELQMTGKLTTRDDALRWAARHVRRQG